MHDATELAQWQKLVMTGQRLSHINLNESLESYLVFLLQRFSTKPEIANRIIGLDFLETQLNKSLASEKGYRDIGDQCLLISGLFPGHSERRRVSLDYYINIGKQAYTNAANTNPSVFSTLHEVSQHFLALRDVLHAMRHNSEQCIQRDLFSAWVIWKQTGSPYAFDALSQEGASLPIAVASSKKH